MSQIAQVLNVDGSSEVNYFELNDAIFNQGGENCVGAWQSAGCRIETFFQYQSRFGSPGAIISTAMPYLFGIAGMILFVMIVWGGIEIMMGASDPKSAENGKNRITSAIIGFLILFGSFWIGQIVQIIFGINIGLGGF